MNPCPLRMNNSPKRARRARRGLSLLEFLGCLVAIVVGIWAGAAFMDIDLQSAWRLGMEKIGVAAPTERPTGERQFEESADSLPGEADDAVGPGHDGPSRKADTAATDPPELSTVGKETLSFWNRLQQIVQHEQQMRFDAQRKAAADTHVILRVHQEAYATAAESIREIPTRSVDRLALKLAEDLAAWYERGAELADEGGSYLDAGELTVSPGPLERRWHVAQKQHAEERDLLRRKCTSVCGKLRARYGVDFADLQ